MVEMTKSDIGAFLARQGILGSGWWRYRLPGLGVLNWTDIFSALREG